MNNTHVLEEAERIINGERLMQYGEARASFTAIAKMWSAFKGIEISATDVAMMMVLLKVARSRHAVKLDSLVDIAGYAALADQMENRNDD